MLSSRGAFPQTGQVQAAIERLNEYWTSGLWGRRRPAQRVPN
jgi:hypothetical protein